MGQAAAVYGGKLQEVTTEDNARTTKAEICTTLGLAHPGIRLLQLLCGHHGDLVHEHRHGRGPTLAVSLQDLRAQATCALVQILQRQLAQCMDGVALQQPCRRIGNSALPDRLWAGKVVDERLGAAQDGGFARTARANNREHELLVQQFAFARTTWLTHLPSLVPPL